MTKIDKKGLVLADFYLDGCGPCRLLTPLLSQLKNIKVIKINAGSDVGLASNFGITSVPTLIFFKDGVEVHRMVGLQTLSTLQSKVDSLCRVN